MPLSQGEFVSLWQTALPTSAFSFCFPSFCPCSLCRTAGTNNPQAAVIWSAMSLAHSLGSKRGLVLSALLACAVIFELGKWLVYFALLRSAMEEHMLCRLHAQSLIKIPLMNILQWCITCSVLCTADCQKGVHNQRSTPARSKTKLVKSPYKSSKSQGKATPAARTRTLLTQVHIYRYTLYFEHRLELWFFCVTWRW